MAPKYLKFAAKCIGLDIHDCKDFNCNVCSLAKSTRPSFPRLGNQVATKCGELVFCDFWGPFRIPGVGKLEQYLLCFMDSHSRFPVLYTCKSKTEFLTKFMAYVQYSNSFGHKIVEVRADNDSVIRDHTVQTWANTEGIRFQWTGSYMHESNGIVERHWRTLTEMTLSLLLASGLPLRF